MDGLWARKPMRSVESGYRRILGLVDLSNIGIAAIIGAGIFVFLGQEITTTGPGVIIALVLAGLAATLAALSYAEAAAILPGSGSAYAFSYAVLGNFPAFMVGWLFINGYAIGNAGVGTGWSKFFVSGLSGLGLDLPVALTRAPLDGGIVNLPAVLFFVVITALAMTGMQTSTRVNNVLVVVKVAIVLFVIVVGAFLIKPANWTPFSPAGARGVAGSTAILFFAYMGFDTIAATGAEAKDPKRNLPLAILISLAVCTLLYVLMAGAVTGIATGAQLGPDAPVADAFTVAGAPWAAGVITAGALVGLATVAYAFHIASARIFQTMAADGFLPPVLARVSRNGIPVPAAIAVGIVSALAAGFVPLGLLISTAVEANITIFIIVSVGILVIRRLRGKPDGFHAPAWLHVAAIVALAAVVVFGIWDPRIHVVFVAWLALGFMVFGFWAHRSSLRVQAKKTSS